ncbi:MAG: hypothetical protein P4L55_20810 [Syntrophobacteraceae bacterium]|nr:hypothetical protein [Syntrophobacteraceae bacterium]
MVKQFEHGKMGKAVSARVPRQTLKGRKVRGLGLAIPAGGPTAAVIFLLLIGVLHPLHAADPAMVAKDLFSTDRRPPALHCEVTDSKAGGQPFSVGNLVLDGVIIRDKEKRAVLRIKNIPAGKVEGGPAPQSPFVVIREGETVRGYRVMGIKDRSVLLQREGKTYTVDLFAEGKTIAQP